MLVSFGKTLVGLNYGEVDIKVSVLALVLLDLDKFDSKADYSVPNKRSEGISQVYVNGKLAFAQDPDVKTFRPGRMLRIK